MEVRADEVNWSDVPFLLPAPDHGRAAWTSGRADGSCSGPPGSGGRNGLREYSRMNAASTSITGGRCLAESPETRSRA